MAGPLRNRLGAGLGLAVVLAVVIGLLFLAGRSWQPGQERSAPSRGFASLDASLDDMSAPPRLLRNGVEFAKPISGLAVTPAAVSVAYGTMIARLDPRTLRTTAS